MAEEVFWKIMMIRVAPRRPRPTVNMPATPPVRKATFSAAGSDPDLAAAAVRTLPRTARLIPMNPVRPERKHPATNAIVRNRPDSTTDNATLPSGARTSVEVRYTTTTRGIRMTRIVRNWRRRYAIAPSWMAAAISFIFSVPWSAARTPFESRKPTPSATRAVTTEMTSHAHSAVPRTNS
jgi:hypothetical protein